MHHTENGMHVDHTCLVAACVCDCARYACVGCDIEAVSFARVNTLSAHARSCVAAPAGAAGVHRALEGEAVAVA